MRLYDLTEDYIKVLDLIEEGAEGLEDTLASIDEAIEVKAENTAKLIKTLDVHINAYKEEEKRLADRRRAVEGRVTNIKTYLEQELRKSGKTKIQGLLHTISIQKNPPSINVLDESKITDNFWIPQPPKLDKKTMLDYLKKGWHVNGVEIVQGESLRIR